MKIIGVKLLEGKQQCISQYADNSSFLIWGRGDKLLVDELVRLLGFFSPTLGI